MPSISEQIIEYAETLPEGSPLCPKNFMHLGDRQAVYQAFSRLTRRDRLRRIYHGVYVKTIETRFGKCSPGIGKVIKALSELWGEKIVYSGGSSANFLGLTTQVPMGEVYLTSGPSRELHFRALKVRLRHAPSWQLAGENRPAGILIRALTFLHVDEVEEVLEKVIPGFSEADIVELAAVCSMMPKWIEKPLSTFVKNG